MEKKTARLGNSYLRLFTATLLFVARPGMLAAQTDWPIYGHDPGGRQFSPLKQINSKNVTQLKVVWTYDARTAAPSAPPSVPPPKSGAEPPRRVRSRQSEASPLVVGNVLYLGTPYNHIVALEADTGKMIWDYESDSAPSTRGIAFGPGEKDCRPQTALAP